MKKLFFKLLFITICFIPCKFTFAASCTAVGESPVRIVGPSFFPPIGWYSEEKRWNPDGNGYWEMIKKPRGFFIDFMTQLLKDNGVTIKPKFIFVGNIDEALEYTERGKADIIFGVPHLADPLLGVELVFPSVLSSPIVTIVRKDKELKVSNRDDLLGIRGLASRTDQFGESFPEYIRKNLTVKRVSSLKEAYSKLLKNDEYTYVMASYYYAHAEAVRLGVRDQLKFIPVPITDIYLFMAVSKKSNCIKQIPNFKRILKEKYVEQNSPDVGVRKILRHSMFEWEEKNGLYRYDPEYQTQADIDLEADAARIENREYKEKWGTEEKRAIDEKEKSDNRKKWGEIWGSRWDIKEEKEEKKDEDKKITPDK